MSHFAQINENNVVINILVIDQDVVNTGIVGDPASWIETSPETKKGVHSLGGTPLRKNFAGIGYTYDPTRDAFIPPKPYPSWVLDETTCVWEPPFAYPADGNKYIWDETTQTWQVISI